MSPPLAEPAGSEATRPSATPPVSWAVAHTFGARGLLLLLTAASGVIIARVLGPAGKGAYDLTWGTANLLVLLLGFSLPSGITWVVARERVDLRGLSTRVGVLAGVAALVALGLVLVVRRTPLASAFLPPDRSKLTLAILAGAVLALAASANWRAIHLGLQRIAAINRRDVAAGAIAFALCAAAALLALSGVRVHYQELALATLAGTAAGAALLAWGSGERSSGPAPTGLRAAFRFAAPCFLGNLAQFLNYRLDVFVVSYYAGLGALGAYTLAVGVAQLLWMVPGAAATVLFARVAAQTDEPALAARRTARVARGIFWLTALGAVGAALLARPLITAVYGAAFAASVLPLRVLLPGTVVFSVTTVLAAHVGGAGSPKLNAVVSTVGLVATVVLDFTLVPRFGIVGAAWASTVSYTLSTVAMVVLFRHFARVTPWLLVWPQPRDLGRLRLLLRESRR